MQALRLPGLKTVFISAPFQTALELNYSVSLTLAPRILEPGPPEIKATPHKSPIYICLFNQTSRLSSYPEPFPNPSTQTPIWIQLLSVARGKGIRIHLVRHRIFCFILASSLFSFFSPSLEDMGAL